MSRREVEEEEEDDYPSYPDRWHNTRSFLDSLADGVPPVNTVFCVRCGAYKHGDVGEHEDDVEKSLLLESGATCWDWWLLKLARDVIST